MIVVLLFQSFTGDTNDGYIVLISPAPPDAPASRNVTDITLTLTGLADYTTYTFTVAAYNAAGVGPATSPQNATTVEGGRYHMNVVFVTYKSLANILFTCHGIIFTC